jgi:4a-hydroxytetrahydrobiopterin dehydratase
MGKKEAETMASAVPLWTLNFPEIHATRTGSKKKSVKPPHISRRLVCKNFRAALDFLNRAGEVMEDQGHHADIHLLNYREITMELHTHFIDGLHKNDFVLAAKLDLVPADLSPKFAAALQQKGEKQ